MDIMGETTSITGIVVWLFSLPWIKWILIFAAVCLIIWGLIKLNEHYREYKSFNHQDKFR